MSRMTPRPSIIFLFRNDLRLSDNLAILEASKKSGGKVIPLYVFDSKQIGVTARSRQLGILKSSPLKTKFLLESIQDLKQQCINLNSDLVVRKGNTAEIIKNLANELSIEHVYTSRETCSEELTVDKQIVSSSSSSSISDTGTGTGTGLKLKTLWTSTLYLLYDLPFDNLKTNFPLIYTQFRKSVEDEKNFRNGCIVRPLYELPRLQPLPSTVVPGDIPSLAELCGDEATSTSTSTVTDERSVLQFHGGSTSGKERINDYIFNYNLLQNYKITRNGMIGSDYSSKLSPWLALGCISPKEIYYEVKRYEIERIANDSTYWLIFELLWRDFFKFLPIRVGTSLFRLEGPRNVVKRWYVIKIYVLCLMSACLHVCISASKNFM